MYCPAVAIPSSVFAGASDAGASGSGDWLTPEDATQEVKSIAPRTRPEITMASLEGDLFMFSLEHFLVQNPPVFCAGTLRLTIVV
jgi:hypothetical protein